MLSFEIENIKEPFCGRRIAGTVPLVETHPELAKEWCYKNNCGFGPEDFSYGSRVKAWWVCSSCNREFKSKISKRTESQSGCPYCANRKVCSDNSLATLYPSIASEWHHEKNGALTPHSVASTSSKIFWWLCSICAHSWKATVGARTLGRYRCPQCKEAKKKNTIKKKTNTTKTVRKIRTLGHDDPGSEIRITQYKKSGFMPFSKTHPSVAALWHPTKNGLWTPNDFSRGADVLAWWQCNEGSDHEWQRRINRSTFSNSGCPCCSGHKVSITNSLEALFPVVAAQWHPEKNGDLTAGKVTAHSGKIVWWKCTEGPDHEWQNLICARTTSKDGRKCPFCCNLKVSKTNSLLNLFPDIASQWYLEWNDGLEPNQVTAYTEKKAWWKCNCSHIWQAEIASRTRKLSGCPECYKRNRRHHRSSPDLENEKKEIPSKRSRCLIKHVTHKKRIQRNKIIG